MGSFSFLRSPRCQTVHCERWAFYMMDGRGAQCDVCLSRWHNEGILAELFELNPPLDERLGMELGMRVMDFIYGDGREGDCVCRRCRTSWVDRGWVCPVVWQRVVHRRWCFCGRCEGPWFREEWQCPEQNRAWQF